MAKRPRTSLTVSLQLDGAKETLKAFRDLPKEASAALRDATKHISTALAGKVKAAAEADESPQSALLAGTVRARRDRVPSIVAGGTKRLGKNRAPAWKLLFGSEFGANRYPQFHKEHTGKKGTWFFPVVDEHQADISHEWNKAADDVIRRFSQGGGA